MLSAMIRKTFLLIIFVVFSSANVQAENWAHWRGPTGNGVALNATPPTEFSDTQNVKWKVEIPGKGSGSPIVWENKVFVVSAISEAPEPEASPVMFSPAITQERNRQERNRGDGAQGGQRQRRQRGGRGGRGGRGRGAKPTMTQFKVYCFDRETGESVWDKTAAEALPHQTFTPSSDREVCFVTRWTVN